MEKSITTYIVDSFTNQPFKGNPAGVCLLEESIPDKLMQSIATELGLSETAFVARLDANHTYAIRFFSPKMEIALCGHATLASSKIVFEIEPTINKIHFINTQNIDLAISRQADLIEMEFPIYETVPAKAPTAMLNALGIDEVTNSAYNSETEILLLEIKDCEVLCQLRPDFAALLRSHKGINGVLVTAPSNKDKYDFESRYFWPWSGTNEDPVTGGTHTFLTKYWSKRLGKRKMNSFQCSKRTGFMEVELMDNEKFAIRGNARIVLKGDFLIDN